MQLCKLEIENFRLLKSFELKLEDELSLVIGKNNTGKTSILSALEKLVVQTERSTIHYEDFNVDTRSFLEDYLNDNLSIVPEAIYIPIGISAKLFMEYNEEDNLAQISPLIMNLDPQDNNIVLIFEYKATYEDLVNLKKDYIAEAEKFDNNPRLFLKENHRDYFGTISRKSVLYGDETQFIDLNKEKINLRDVLSIQFINAKRSVTNKQNDKALSNQTSTLYKQQDESDEHEEASGEFKKALRDTDGVLSDVYAKMFDGVIKKVNQFGGVTPLETEIKISSSLQHRELLDGNTTVMYSHDSHELPEHYNGLGYMNLISMIFDIEMLMSRLRRSVLEKPAAINILFIEEPEAHTHPQMQYVFIKNIKQLLRENRNRDDGITIHLQTIITTHSSHIVAESDFNDIKYLKKSESRTNVTAKSLRDLQSSYSNQEEQRDTQLKQDFKFLKQYLTLNRAELFFADKAIFIEGDTERVILPAMMKKIDQDIACDDAEQPLLSQNISIVEVGAHSQIFEKFIDFIGINSLIITDIDSFKLVPKKDEPEKTEREKCPPNDANARDTSNASLKYFFGTDADLAFFKSLAFEGKTLSKTTNGEEWRQNECGNLKIVYQTEEEGFYARSYEDAFFHINKSLLNTGISGFPSLTNKHLEKYMSNEIDAYEFAEKAVGSKPSLAIEVLLNSEKDENNLEFSNWKVPAYIKEGLLWLRRK
ncbi:ATP-dependent endonuclease [Aliiglaciecola sp.]|nr:ATP-dependent endonuclease [Aliiglaciecola sp.]